MKQKNSEERWRITHRILAACTVTEENICIENMRDFRYPHGSEDKPEERFVDMDFKKDDVVSAWIAIIPFRPHFAHLITSFGLRDGRYIAISIEIRYQEGEPYILHKTFMPHYWLSYVVATEDDVFRVRTDVRNKESVYLYKLSLSEGEASRMCTAMLLRAQKVNHDHPERFNSVWNSCTSNVLTHLRKDAGKKLTWSRAHYLTDRLDPYLAKQHVLDIKVPYTQNVRTTHCINAIAQNISPEVSNFSKRIRTAIGY